MFLAQLENLCWRLRRYQKIYMICDRAKCRTGEEVAIDLWNLRDRSELHLLPAHRADGNPIERMWWHLHEAVKRNHPCKSMQGRLKLTFARLSERNPFQVEKLSFNRAAA